MDTLGNTAAICVRRSAADERDADDSDRRGVGFLGHESVGTPRFVKRSEFRAIFVSAAS